MFGEAGKKGREAAKEDGDGRWGGYDKRITSYTQNPYVSIADHFFNSTMQK
jgi:hypothetical protein